MSVRAIQIWQNKVYYAATDSKFGYIRLKEPTIRKQMKLSDANLQFRTLAQTDDLFYTVNIESPATFYKITKSTFTAEEVFTDTIKTAFYDAFMFDEKGRGLAISDPRKEGKPHFKNCFRAKIIKTKAELCRNIKKVKRILQRAIPILQ